MARKPTKPSADASTPASAAAKSMRSVFESLPPGSCKVSVMKYGDVELLKEGESLKSLTDAEWKARLSRAFRQSR